MKAPDKIYFEIDEKGKVHTYFGLQPENATEYIRKDALLGWVKEMKRICRGAEPIEKAYQTILDKLNSM